MTTAPFDSQARSGQSLVRVDPDDVTIPDPESARSALDHYLGTGDLSRLAGAQRAALYLEVCRSLAINPRTRPLDWIEFYDPETKARKLTLYPNKTCTDQLAYLHRIRVRLVEEKIVGTLYKVVLEGTMPDGRQETNVAYLDLTDQQGQPLRGQRYGNALMKCHTKAKRRLVLGMVGMSIPDDDTLPKARRVYVDAGGNIIERPTEEQRHLIDNPRVAGVIGEPTFEDAAAGVETGLEGEPSLPVRDDPGPQRTDERPTFRPSAETVKRWLGAWFASVKGTSLDDDSARHRFVRQYGDGRTESLRFWFEHATEAQAADLLAHVRVLADEERKAIRLADATNDTEGPLPADRPSMGPLPHGAARRGSVVPEADEITDDERPF
jgi:hypothetical protein